MNSKHLTLLRHPLGFLVIGIVPLIIGVAGCSNSTRAEGESKAVRTGGGPCEYNRYQGACRITSVRQMGSDQNYRELPYHGYQVRFSFQTEHKIEPYYGSLLEKEHTLKLTNSWPPGPRFLQKYAIKEGAVFDCYLNVMVHGTCTPIHFDFPAINLSDYFEIQER
jgi:hypothetical protein